MGMTKWGDRFAVVFFVGIVAWAPTTFAVDGCGQFPVDPLASLAFHSTSRPLPHSCRVRVKDGFPLPDPACSPGAINPTITVEILRDRFFRTGCIRNQATSEQQKRLVYSWYGIPHPGHNFGNTQICELDHVVPLELGGADGLENIFPQCGPADAPLRERFFKRKDTVENFLAWAVKSGRIDLATAQREIASDWTQFLQAAEATCPGGRCPRLKRTY